MASVKFNEEYKNDKPLNFAAHEQIPFVTQTEYDKWINNHLTQSLIEVINASGIWLKGKGFDYEISINYDSKSKVDINSTVSKYETSNFSLTDWLY